MASNAALADPAAVADWNRRVRRLAQDYAPKYRPVFFPIAYHTNIDAGRAWPRVETIARESARYRDGKPLSRAAVYRLMAEMENAGAIKSEARFSEETGRQRSSYRYLVTSVAVNRHGYSIPHDFHAPFPQVDEGSQEHVTGELQVTETLRETLRETPLTTFNSNRTRDLTTSHARGTSLEDYEVKVSTQGQAQGSAAQPPAQPGSQNTIYFWKDGQGRNRVYAKPRYDRL